jgi:hypothetical protein
MAVCHACKQHQPVKLYISSGNDKRSFCVTCYERHKGVFDPKFVCIMCTSPAKVEYLYSVIFGELPGKPIFSITCCSSQCYAAVARFAEQSQDGLLTIVCLTCNKDVTHCRLQCSRCKGAFYCSRECQKANWSRHKHTCQQVTHIPTADTYTMEESMAIAAANGLTFKTDL